MKAILKKVNEPAVLFEGTISYEFMVDTVGGFIQMVSIGPEITVVCNEEGMFAGPGGEPLPQNAAGFLGNILIVATDSDSGECRDMTTEELRKAFRYLEVLEHVEHPMHSGGPVVEMTFGKEAEAMLRQKIEGTIELWNSL